MFGCNDWSVSGDVGLHARQKRGKQYPAVRDKTSTAKFAKNGREERKEESVTGYFLRESSHALAYFHETYPAW